MSNEIYTALLGIIQSGGTLALWGIFIWLGMGLVRVVTICLMLYLVAKLITETIKECYRISKESRQTTVSLLSNQVTGTLTTALETYSKTVEALLKSIEERLSNLPPVSKEK